MTEKLFRGFHADSKGETIIHLNGEQICGEWVEVGINDNPPLLIPETVCRPVGETDKHGIHIYEGDVLKYGKGLYTIRWDEKLLGFGYVGLSVRMDKIDCRHGEVVGNIFETPELCKHGGA